MESIARPATGRDLRAFRLLTIVLWACYPVGVVWLVFWKWYMEIPDEAAPWAEVVLGPALTIGSVWLFATMGMGIEGLVRGRGDGAGASKPLAKDSVDDTETEGDAEGD